MDPTNPDDTLLRAYALATSLPVTEFMRRVNEIAGYSSPTGADKVFEAARVWLGVAPPTACLKKLMERATSPESHFNVLKGGAWPHGNVHSALRRTYSHRDNFARMEREIVSAARSTGVAEMMRTHRGALGGGDTCALDAEYQAFILSARGCLDYLTHTIAAYFGQKYHNFHELPVTMLRWKPPEFAERLLDELRPRHAALSHFFSDGTNKSVRDRIVHREFVRAGCLNVTAEGVFLADTSEPGASSGAGVTGDRLLPSLDEHVRRIEGLIDGMLGTLITIDRQATAQP
jgi:hypothetical protein